MGTHPIFESDFDCLTGNSFEVMEDQINPKCVRMVCPGCKPGAIKVDTGMKYDKFLKDLLEELDDKDEFEERFDDYLKDELDKFKSCGTTIEEKVKTILELFNECDEQFDEDDLAEAKKTIEEYYPAAFDDFYNTASKPLV